MSAYVLNIKKGTIINHPLHKFIGGVAYEMDDKVALQFKHIINLLIFDDVVHIDKGKVKKKEKV